ncbi:MAG: geranylgeranylglycerol-phosphate geranylgeranyltransferase [Chloroflexota bacterium]
MSQLKALFKISRPLSTLSGVFAVLLGGYIAGGIPEQWGKVALAALATLLVSASANAWNDYLDIEIDKINQPKRPLPAGLISPRAVVIFSISFAVLSLIIALFINPLAFGVVLVSNALLYVYSWKLKSTVLFGNATVAAISALSAIFGGVAVENIRPTFWIALTIGLAIMGREILKTLADYEGDLHEHCRTIATVWGRKPARIFFYILLAATLIVMFISFFKQGYHPIYAYIVAFGVYPVALYILMTVSRERTGPQLEKLSQIFKYDFFVWFLAVFLGAAV